MIKLRVRPEYLEVKKFSRNLEKLNEFKITGNFFLFIFFFSYIIVNLKHQNFIDFLTNIRDLNKYNIFRN